MRIAMLKKRFCHFMLLGCAALSACVSAAELRTEQVPWPQLPPCKVCLMIEFDVLRMQMSRDLIGKIVVVNLSVANLSIVPSGFGDMDSFGFIVQEPERITTLFKTGGIFTGAFERLRIVTNEDFFDRLGESLPADKALSAMRNVLLKDAVRYTKAKQGKVAAFRIYSARPNDERVYIVVDGYERIIQIAGHLTDELYREFLARLTVVF